MHYAVPPKRIAGNLTDGEIHLGGERIAGENRTALGGRHAGSHRPAVRVGDLPYSIPPFQLYRKMVYLGFCQQVQFYA